MREFIDNNIYTLRTACAFTQEAFAKRVGVSRQTVIAIEKGNYTPSVHLAIKIEKVFNVSVEKVFSISHEK